MEHSPLLALPLLLTPQPLISMVFWIWFMLFILWLKPVLLVLLFMMLVFWRKLAKNFSLKIFAEYLCSINVGDIDDWKKLFDWLLTRDDDVDDNGGCWAVVNDDDLTNWVPTVINGGGGVGFGLGVAAAAVVFLIVLQEVANVVNDDVSERMFPLNGGKQDSVTQEREEQENNVYKENKSKKNINLYK